MKTTGQHKKLFKIVLSILLITTWICWDIIQAKKWDYLTKGYKVFGNVDTITSATSKVSIIPSDYASLANPVTRTTSLTYQQVEDMVRKAIEEAGGIDWLIDAGDMVLLKPNIVEREVSGSGEITDVRVIKALIKIIDNLAPGNIEIVVGEGSPRPMEHEVPYSIRFKTAVWETLWDVPGYQDLLTDPYLAGINLRLSNLNGSPPENPWKDLIPIQISGGGMATPHENQYYIHKDVLNADVFITVPVLKSHKVGMTCALKNQIGLAPSTKYGFSKTGGVPQDGYAYKLYHRSEAPRDWVDEEVVDFCTLADIDFVVVDAINCLETSKEAIWNNGTISNQIRMNSIVAGADPVAVDHVCAKVIGMNPDDLAFLTLAEKIGMGNNDFDNIEVTGAAINDVKRAFKKDPYYTSDYGQGNRQWILSGPHSTDGIDNPMLFSFLQTEANAVPQPNQNGWSQEIYFFDDRIDLREYYNDPLDVVSYAACYFTAAEEQIAEFWLGSDEALKIWLNGEVIYNYNANRIFNKSTLVNEKINVDIKQGENRLLVKTLQTYGYYDFSLNICEIESNKHFDGNRVSDLKFKTAPTNTSFSTVNLLPFSLDVPSVEPGESYAVEKFSVKTETGTAFWNAIDVNIGGNCPQSNIQAIQIWADNGDQIFNKNSDARISQHAYYADKIQFAFAPVQEITTSSKAYFIVIVVSEQKQDPSGSIVFVWNSQDDFHFDNPVVLNSDFPISSLSVSLPVELVSFAVYSENGGAQLIWHVVDEVNVLGYEIQKSSDGKTFVKTHFIPAKDINLDKKQYSYFDDTIGAGKTFYRLRIIDNDGSEELSGIVEAQGVIPRDFLLANPYPNPFNNGTRIEYQLPNAGEINLSIFNTNGQFIKTLAQGYFSSPGSYSAQWDGTNNFGSTVSTGIYMIVLKTEFSTQVRKAVFSK
jgi:uncharacterized protein (DUF362 family)